MKNWIYSLSRLQYAFFSGLTGALGVAFIVFSTDFVVLSKPMTFLVLLGAFVVSYIYDYFSNPGRGDTNE